MEHTNECLLRDMSRCNRNDATLQQYRLPMQIGNGCDALNALSFVSPWFRVQTPRLIFTSFPNFFGFAPRLWQVRNVRRLSDSDPEGEEEGEEQDSVVISLMIRSRARNKKFVYDLEENARRRLKQRIDARTVSAFFLEREKRGTTKKREEKSRRVCT